ncbi:GMC oxidoreductase [Bradyrhizobium sp.]|uniref:GMC family oxidoreductase n=1 Tax=Bradyrhizobium sp. TaxID=376 RepID=UPI0025BF0815|nr:GMC oxidoreductase [Bradyrhizobium sp.]
MHDLIIVGAGTAGAVLAERLTASGRNRVLLIEAGGEPKSPFVKIPAGFAKLFRGKLDWGFGSVHSRGDVRRDIVVPRGKMLGGSANMNAQIHQWCHPADFNGWAANGAAGWSWEDVRGTFAAQECLSGSGAPERGRTGRMTVTPVADPHPLSKAYVAAARRVLVNSGDQYNGGAYEGAWISEIAHQGGRRYSAYDAYLVPARQRTNLQVLKGATVSRVLVESGRSVGVEVDRAGQSIGFRCGKGVILAGGAFGTPYLLLHSGIGPAQDLSKLGIRAVLDVPEVGRGLQDHPLVPLVFATSRTDTFKNAESISNLLRYLLFKKGMLASNAVEAIAFAQSSRAVEPAPDIELIFAPFEWRGQGLQPPQRHAFTIAPVMVKPKSRGTVTLSSPRPGESPVIDFNLLADTERHDMQVMLEGIRLARQVAVAAPLGGDAIGEVDPGPLPQTEEALADWIHRNVQTVYHPTSTCRMGNDTGSVVDPQLRVRGIGGLWIADASVMPSIPRGHPNAVVAMIAERAAALIEEADTANWPSPRSSVLEARKTHAYQTV